MRPFRSPLRRGGRPDRIVNERALLLLLALNVHQITILNFDAVALTEGTPSSAFVSGLVLVVGASAGAFLFMFDSALVGVDCVRELTREPLANIRLGVLLPAHALR